MSQASPTPSECCQPCESPVIVNTPGATGATGAAGAAGANGVTAFSASTDAFTQPAVNANVTLDVTNSTWMSIGQIVFVTNGGYYEVVAKPTNVEVTLENLGITGNAAPTTVIATGQQVSPAGPIGPTGPAGSAGYLDGTDTLDFPSVAANGGTQGRNIAVLGAAINDPISMGPPSNINAGLVPYATIVVADVVTIVLTNCTTGALNPPAGIWKVRVHK